MADSESAAEAALDAGLLRHEQGDAASASLAASPPRGLVRLFSHGSMADSESAAETALDAGLLQHQTSTQGDAASASQAVSQPRGMTR